MDAALVVVNFESGHRLAQLLDRFRELQVVVVDNASEDGSELAAEGRDGVTLLRNEENLGFATAANQGAVFVSSEWIVFVNPDADVGPADLGSLLEGVPAGVGAVAPVQTDARGRPLEETGGHDPSLPRFFAWALLPRRLRRDRGPWLGRIPDDDFSPDWVSGAAMAVRRVAFSRLHGFDTRLFLYLEDADLCRRLRTAGWDILCRPGVRVVHEIGQSDPERRARQTELFVTALGERFGGPRRRALGLILCLGYGLRSLGRNPAARAGLAAARGLVRGKDAG